MTQNFPNLGALKDVEAFQRHLRDHRIDLPCDSELLTGDKSPLAQPLQAGDIRLANRFAIQPMEGWDGTADGKPTELTIRRWQNFGRSGAKLIWGGEAVAVRHDGRANPNQLVINEHTQPHLAGLRDTLLLAHKQCDGADAAPLI